MYLLKSMETEILNYLYELGVLCIFWGWESQSNLDENAVERLYVAKLVDKSDPLDLCVCQNVGWAQCYLGHKTQTKFQSCYNLEVIRKITLMIT